MATISCDQVQSPSSTQDIERLISAALRQLTSQRRQLPLCIEQLLAHVHDYLNTGQINPKLIDQALDKADLLDIRVAEVANVAAAALWRDQAPALIHA